MTLDNEEPKCSVEMVCTHPDHNEHAPRFQNFTAAVSEHPFTDRVKETNWTPVYMQTINHEGKVEHINVGTPICISARGYYRIFCHCPICRVVDAFGWMPPDNSG